VQVGIARLGDLAKHAATDDHFIALCDGVDHGLVLLLTLHLRPDHHEVQHHEHQHDGQHARQTAEG